VLLLGREVLLAPKVPLRPLGRVDSERLGIPLPGGQLGVLLVGVLLGLQLFLVRTHAGLAGAVLLPLILASIFGHDLSDLITRIIKLFAVYALHVEVR